MQLQSNSSHQLSAVLQTVAKNISAKNALAILSNVLLSQREDGKFIFTASNSTSQIAIPAPLTLVEGKFSGQVALSANDLVSYLSTLPDCVVNLSFDDAAHSMRIDYSYTTGSNEKAGNFAVPYLDGGEFPLLHGIEGDHRTIDLPVPLFLDAVAQAKVFSANDDLRIVLNSLCIDVEEDFSQCKLVSTDGHSLIKFTHTNTPATGGSDFYRGGVPGQSMIPKTVFPVLTAFSGCETVRIESTDDTICISSGDIVFITKAIEGRFPNYEAIIPKNSAYRICVSKKEILSVLKRVAICASKATNMVVLKKDGIFLTITANDIDFATSACDQVFITDGECPDGFRIAFKAQNLSNVISAINGETVRMNMESPVQACVITADEPSPIIHTLIMPMMIQD